MSRATVDFMNARRAALPAAGGSFHSEHRYLRDAATYAPPDAFENALEAARAQIAAFAIWAEVTRQQQAERLGIPQQELTDDIPF